ncbi:TetR/AcrR family transcriptional regulator [Paenibacillus sp. y28]|uniref:TetR/AcrR family transcriptional regulator n=1 Tax=Paenibacillus sp. y28 TaxID=3129110 RepID=UPI00301865D2
MKKQTEARDVKLKILEAARKLFSEVGYEGTSVRQICEEAGVALALVSYHFGGKENVFYALVDTYFTQDIIPEPVEEPVLELKRFVEKQSRFFLSNQDLMRIFQQEVMMNSPRLEKMIPLIMCLRRNLRVILEAGVKQGVFEIDTMDDTCRFIINLMALPKIQQIAILTNIPLNPPEEQVVNVVRFIFRGIGYKQDVYEAYPAEQSG